jgi:hypothetical protein
MVSVLPDKNSNSQCSAFLYLTLILKTFLFFDLLQFPRAIGLTIGFNHSLNFSVHPYKLPFIFIGIG